MAVNLKDLTCEELREARDGLLRSTEVRNGGATDDSDRTAVWANQARLKDIEAEIAKRCDEGSDR